MKTNLSPPSKRIVTNWRKKNNDNKKKKRWKQLRVNVWVIKIITSSLYIERKKPNSMFVFTFAFVSVRLFVYCLDAFYRIYGSLNIQSIASNSAIALFCNDGWNQNGCLEICVRMAVVWVHELSRKLWIWRVSTDQFQFITMQYMRWSDWLAILLSSKYQHEKTLPSTNDFVLLSMYIVHTCLETLLAIVPLFILFIIV